MREKIAAEFDLLDQFRGYIERLIGKNDPKALARAKAQIGAVEDNPASLRALLNIALNQQSVRRRAGPRAVPLDEVRVLASG